MRAPVASDEGFGRSDPMLLRPERRDLRLVQDPDDANDDVLRAVIEPRMVVNINMASRPVLQALFDGIEAWYVEAPNRAVFPNTPTNPNRDPDDGGPVRISRDEARLLAEAMILRRESVGPFASWKAVFDFLGSPEGQNAFTGSADLRVLKGDTVFASLNPNTDSWRFNPNRCWGSLNRRGAGDSYVFRGVDKFDLVGADGVTPTFTTEGSLHPSGVFEITSLGRVVETDSNRVVAQAKIRTVVRIFDVVGLSTQADFEGTSPRLTGSNAPAAHRQDLVISGEATKTQVQTYPEFDPRSWRSQIPQSYTDAAGYLVSGQGMPALYDGQIMLGIRHMGPDPALFVDVPLAEDGDDTDNDFRNVIPGGGLGMFANDLIEQRSLIEPETQQLNATSVTHVSNSPTTIPRFERDANLQPDGIQFVTRRGLVHGGGSVPGRGTIQFWAKPMFPTHDDREDDLILMERNGRGDPLYSPGFNANGHGNISPALFCDWTMNGHILGLWQTFYPSNYTHFIMQSSLTYEWHSAVMSRPIQRGEWVLMTGVFDATHSELFINSEQASGPNGSTFNLTNVFSTNWGIWSSRVKPAIAHSTMGDLRALRDARSAIDVGIDYLDGRYHSTGSWTSPLLEIPGGKDVRFLGIAWTELVPDQLASGGVELSVDVEPGAGFAADAGPFADPTANHQIGATGRRFRIRADLSAQPSMGEALIETPVLDDITIFFDRGETEILSWETLQD